MSFDNWADFWAMGGYAAFVWPCYALSAILLIALAIQSWHRHARIKTELQRLERLQQRERKHP